MAETTTTPSPSTSETLETLQARHRKEARDLQSVVTSKKKNATKKTRRGVNSECDELERELKVRQAREVAALDGTAAVDEGTIPDSEDEVDDAAEALGAMNVAELGAKAPQQPTQSNANGNGTAQQQQGGGGGGSGGGAPGKKRNRQKERLARRAADLEASALAAEAEASTQTDHRALERTAMQAAFAAHGRVEHEIRPDGHCLFSAVADQITTQLPDVPLGSADEREPGYKTVRRRAAEYVGAHGDRYAGFLEEGVESYVAKMRDSAEWGGQVELAALAEVYGVEVWVVRDGGVEVVRPAEGEVEGGRRVWLAYYRHGYGLGEHYNSLRKA